MAASSTLRVDLRLVDLRQLEREAHVLAHGHVRVERVVLEHHRDVAVLRRLVVHHLVADPQLALGDVLEPGDHPQRGGLAAAGGPDEDHELAVLDREAHVPDGLEAVRVPLRDVVQDDLCHSIPLREPFQPLTAPAVSPATMRRWKIRTMMMMGIVTTTAAAEIAPIGSEKREPPEKKASAAGTVWAFDGGRQRVREEEVVPREDEHEDRRGEHPGAASGTMTLRNAWNGVAPSTWAACSSSHGISRKNADSV